MKNKSHFDGRDIKFDMKPHILDDQLAYIITKYDQYDEQYKYALKNCINVMLDYYLLNPIMNEEIIFIDRDPKNFCSVGINGTLALKFKRIEKDNLKDENQSHDESSKTNDS
jgi:hypothetical protein